MFVGKHKLEGAVASAISSFNEGSIHLIKVMQKLAIESNEVMNIDIKQLVNRRLTSASDEYHHVLICPYFKQIREKYLKAYYYIRPSYVKLEQLFCFLNNIVLLKLAKFSTLISKEFRFLYVYFKIMIITIIFQMTDYHVFYLQSHIICKFIYVFVSSNV